MVRLEIEAVLTHARLMPLCWKSSPRCVSFSKNFYKAQDFPIVEKCDLLKLIVDEQPFGADRVALEIEGEKLPISIFSARMASRAMHATHYQTHASTPMKTVLELGGGFGRCLRDCLSINSSKLRNILTSLWKWTSGYLPRSLISRSG